MLNKAQIKIMKAHHLLWASSNIRNSIACIPGSLISILRKEFEPDCRKNNKLIN